MTHHSVIVRRFSFASVVSSSLCTASIYVGDGVHCPQHPQRPQRRRRHRATTTLLFLRHVADTAEQSPAIERPTHALNNAQPTRWPRVVSSQAVYLFQARSELPLSQPSQVKANFQQFYPTSARGEHVSVDAYSVNLESSSQ